eukprot:3186000-Rhodomonas_salina.1
MSYASPLQLNARPSRVLRTRSEPSGTDVGNAATHALRGVWYHRRPWLYEVARRSGVLRSGMGAPGKNALDPVLSKMQMLEEVHL